MMQTSCLFIVLALTAPSQKQTDTHKDLSKPRIAVYTNTLNTSHQLIGPLGKPLGVVVTVKATVRRHEDRKIPQTTLEVTELDGAHLPKSIEMSASLWQWGSNLSELKPGRQMTLRVYQTGGMHGHPYQALEEMGHITTTGYGFSTSLVVLKEVTGK